MKPQRGPADRLGVASPCAADRLGAASSGAAHRLGAASSGAAKALGLLFILLAGCRSDPTLSPAQEAELAAYVSDTEPPDLARLDVDFDGKVKLLGASVSPKQSLYPPGTQVKITLAWRAEQKLSPGFLLFTHLVGPGGESVANLDDRGPLRHIESFPGQPLPPSRWTPGKVYRDEISFTIPDGVPPVVTVAAGIWNGKDRMPAKGASVDRQGRVSAVRLNTGAKDMRSVLKEMSVMRLPPGASIKIDGHLDDPPWQGAATTGAFVDVGNGRENPAAPTQGEARLLWDEKLLYIGFEVRDQKVRGGFPPDAKDPHLWERDTVEIMIDPDGDGDNKDYYEIQVSPQNLVFDTQYDDYNTPNGNGKGPFGHEEWSAGLSSAVVVHGTIDDDSDVDRGYTVEMQIPWASFTKAKASPPPPGASWRMNFYAMQNNGGVAWSPILGMGNFHRASRFGVVHWVTPEVPQPLPAISAAASASAAPAAISASASASAAPAAISASAAPPPHPSISASAAPRSAPHR